MPNGMTTRVRFAAAILATALYAPNILGAGVVSTPRVTDSLGDTGESLDLTWEYQSSDPSNDTGLLIIERMADGSGDFAQIKELAPKIGKFSDTGLIPNQPYVYRLSYKEGAALTPVTTLPATAPVLNPFKSQRLNALVLFSMFCAIVLACIWWARRGKEMYIRRIAGLNAIEEAIGRATEMGKKVLYIPGIMSMDDVQTIASMSVLSYVAKYSANYDTLLEVPNKDPLTFAASRETVREAFLAEGKPENYREEMVSYVTYDQFAYTASVSGKMVRERPAANFFIGSFYAEALLLAEAGHNVGAIQIAGTAETAQLPFFVCTCDYTLIGEELYAASAYISRDPLMVGSIKGQDYMKAILIAVLVAGVVFETCGLHWITDFLATK